jgi:hypothetical protein
MNLPKLPEPLMAASKMVPARGGAFGAMYSEAQMLQFQRDTVEACAKVIEADLYPEELGAYQREYNAGIRRSADQLRKMK